MMTNVIAVGTDGTDSSNAAVDWAAHEAHRRGMPLRIVHVFDWEWSEARYDFSGQYVKLARGIAEATVQAAAERALTIAPDLAVETETLIGHAVSRLLEVARTVRLLVLGSRGRGGFAGLLLGSVSQRVATHSPGSVVVVREQPEAGDGPIVAGVDDSAGGDLILETAYVAAAEQGCPITVIHAYLPVIPLWVADVAPPTIDTPQQDADERDRLEERLAPWRSKYPDVPLKVVVTHESAASALVEASRKARLVVVGSHGHGLLASSLLGSTGLQLLYHSACPVHIVRPHAD